MDYAEGRPLYELLLDRYQIDVIALYAAMPLLIQQKRRPFLP